MSSKSKFLIGHEKLLDKIKSEEYFKQIPHAQLFHGPRGNGSLGLVMLIAKTLLCEDVIDFEPCDSCSSCKRVMGFVHPDLHIAFPTVQAISKTSFGVLDDWRELTKKGFHFNISDWINHIDSKGRKPIISVEESKEIIKKMTLKSFEGGYKVVIIWMAEYMNTECSNKLLKLIEEPPERTVFLLLASEPHKILPTTLSRTQKVFVPKIDDVSVQEFLNRHLDMSKDAAKRTADFIQGDLSMVFNTNLSMNENINYFQLFSKLMRVSYKKDVNQMMNWAQEVSQCTKDQQKQFLKYSLKLVQESIKSNYVGLENVKVSSEEEEFLEKFAPYICEKNIREFVALFENSHYHIDRNVNSEIMFTQMCFQTMRYIHKS